MSLSRDHVQQDLPHALLNAPPAARSLSKPPSDNIIPSAASGDSIRDSHDTRPREDTDKDTLKMEARLCQDGVSRLKVAIALVDNNITQLLEVRKKLESRQKLLSSCVTRLATPDDVLVTKATAMLPRLRRVREECRPPPEVALTKLTEDVNIVDGK
nr:hypothetical protein BaRGS_015206 [Batillaria attramentaria]